MEQVRSLGTQRQSGVRAVDRALDVLRAFSDEHPALYLHELADATELPKATTHRIARSLVRSRFLRQDAEGRYLLGDQLIMLGAQAAAVSPTFRVVEPLLDELAGRCQESLFVADVDWDMRSFVIVYRRDGVHQLLRASPPGRRTPISGGAFGKAALATVPSNEIDAILAGVRLVRRTPRSVVDPMEFKPHLAATRERGWAIDTGEYVDGVTCIARAVRAEEGTTGVLAVAAPSRHVSERRAEELGELLVELTDRYAPAPVPEVSTIAPWRRRR